MKKTIILLLLLLPALLYAQANKKKTKPAQNQDTVHVYHFNFDYPADKLNQLAQAMKNAEYGMQHSDLPSIATTQSLPVIANFFQIITATIKKENAKMDSIAKAKKDTTNKHK